MLVLDLLKQPYTKWLEIGYGMVVAGAMAYACIHFFLQTINRLGFMPFVLYRLLLGGILFLFFV